MFHNFRFLLTPPEMFSLEVTILFEGQFQSYLVSSEKYFVRNSTSPLKELNLTIEIDSIQLYKQVYRNWHLNSIKLSIQIPILQASYPG